MSTDRESMSFDVVIVGAGPAGLSAAIRIKQAAPERSVVVLEKGAEVGAHILSGAVVDAAGVDALLPGWRKEADHPFKTEVTEDRFSFLSAQGGWTVPQWLMRFMPPLMSNHGNFIVSLGEVCKWLGLKAEALGVEIYPGFAGAELLYRDDGAVIGVATGDMGIEKTGEPGPNFARGMALLGKYVLLAEGARGSLSKQAISCFGLDKEADPPKFGLGLKEVWEISPEKHHKGRVEHTMGWPLGDKTGGGAFLYHYGETLLSIGFVVHLDYKNPYLSPFEEFQRFKTHPQIKALLKGGRRLSYGARALTEGGWQSVPKLVFPGGALVGCSAGFVNVPRIKGVHNAMVSGLAAGESVAKALSEGRESDRLEDYHSGWRTGPIGRDLFAVRNVKPLWSRFGTRLGVLMSGLEMWSTTLFRGWSPFGTLHHKSSDHLATEPAARHQPIAYPKPDGVVSFDRLSSVFISNTNHAENQPVHLLVKDKDLQRRSEHDAYAGLSRLYCPAGVYEWIEELDGPRYVINAQNCVHCKTCDIKDPNANINWVPPQGGEGPIYQGM